MKYFVILFLFVQVVVFTQQKVINGRVESASDKTPLHLANVFIEGKQIGAIADERGEFSIDGDFSIEDFLVVSYVGFQTKRIPIAEIIDFPFNVIRLEKTILQSQTVLVRG
jgi:hypothetical protein